MAGSIGIGARGSTRASYQPLPSAYRTVTMWSVKTRPNPGSRSSADRSAAATGCSVGRISKSMLSPPVIANLRRGIRLKSDRSIAASAPYPNGR